MIGYYSYMSAALGFGFLAVLLLFSGRSSVPGRLLTAVAICSAIWALTAMSLALDDRHRQGAYQVFEILRYIAWFAFLMKVFEPAARRVVGYRFLRRRALYLFCGLALLVGGLELAVLQGMDEALAHELMWVRQMGHIFLAIIGLAIIEQIYRNVTAEYYQALKYLFIGAGCIFAFDFYLYANAMLFLGIDRQLWEARGVINLVAVPLLALSAARNRDWSPNIFVSRDMVLHTTTIVGGGLYLLVMAGAGYYLQEYGGKWGHVAKVTFFTLAVVFLVSVLFSAQWRRQLRVFLGKHFYRNKYDYRREWLALTAALSETGKDSQNHQTAIRVLAQVVDARAGLLWLRDDQDNYRNVAAWSCARVSETEAGIGELVQFLVRGGYVINLLETGTHAEEYAGLRLPGWLRLIENAWLIVPLLEHDKLLGFVVLARPVLVREVNWEDRDLLKTVARQVASHLAVVLATDALAQVRQFEVFNRLSSYMVHDLKNIAAELEMVAKNATRHRDNPEFLQDAFDSVSTAALDIRRLLDQLRSKQVVAGKRVMVDMNRLLEEVILRCSSRQPVPLLQAAVPGCLVTAERDRLQNVLLHLLENAQQATPGEGDVTVVMSHQGNMCVVDIEDTGIGMDSEFIEQRLFKPFDTTKGNAGMGIGMYESREFIQQLGGEIRVNSTPGKGTTISLFIPASQVETVQGAMTGNVGNTQGGHV